MSTVFTTDIRRCKVSCRRATSPPAGAERRSRTFTRERTGSEKIWVLVDLRAPAAVDWPPFRTGRGFARRRCRRHNSLRLPLETVERSPVAKAPPGWPARFVPPRRHRVQTTALRIPRDSVEPPNMLRESLIHTGRSGGSGCNSGENVLNRERCIQSGVRPGLSRISAPVSGAIAPDSPTTRPRVGAAAGYRARRPGCGPGWQAGSEPATIGEAGHRVRPLRGR